MAYRGRMQLLVKNKQLIEAEAALLYEKIPELCAPAAVGGRFT